MLALVLILKVGAYEGLRAAMRTVGLVPEVRRMVPNEPLLHCYRTDRICDHLHRIVDS
jgi:hypothetical protein